MLRHFLLLMPVIFCTASMSLGQDRQRYAPGMVAVQFLPEVAHKTGLDTGLQEFDQKVALFGGYSMERIYPFLDYVDPTPKIRQNLLALRRTYYVRYHSNAPPEQVADELKSSRGILYAEPVAINHTQALRFDEVPNDPEYYRQYALQQLHLPEAWDIVKGEDGFPRVVIAIVGGGGDWKHEDLRENVWTNPDEIAGNGVDDDNNGFVDDVHGVNFHREDSNDPTGSPETPQNAHHGTAVAGIAGAVADNGIGVAGTSWNAEIMHVNAGCADTDRFICFGYEGIVYAATNGADIINASWSSFFEVTPERSRLLGQSLDLATDMGALVVASAGNGGKNLDQTLHYPARHPRVLSVGATERSLHQLASFSNYGKTVSVYAPGRAIATTRTGGGFTTMSGTSAATPLVSGIAALIKTRYPDMPPDRLHEYIRLTSDPIDAKNPGYEGKLGNGFVNAREAVQTSPSSSGVRLKRFSWSDGDGDMEISSGDEVVVEAVFANYLEDAQQLQVQLGESEPYPFLNWQIQEVVVGLLEKGDSVTVEFGLGVTEDAPMNQRIQLSVHIRDGTLENSVGVLSFMVNESVTVLHQALSALYSSTNGDQWVNKSGWDTGTEPPSIQALGQWHGLSVAEGALVQIKLLHNNLVGNLPPDLANLTNLKTLWLDNNQLTGTIPPELGNLQRMESLHLFKNDLTGVIPSELGDLLQLESLLLSDNRLDGKIPPELGNLSHLTRLTLSNNQLSESIPPEFGKLKNLTALHLEGNRLTGKIPQEICNLSQLSELRMHENDFAGKLPRCFLKLQKLHTLHFADAGVCAPPDDEFQAWLGTISNMDGPTCKSVSFSASTADQSYDRGYPIMPLILPEANDGIPPTTYSLTPALPEGLSFSQSTRTLSGTPRKVMASTPYTYTATDSEGFQDSLVFEIEIYHSVRFTTSIDPQSYPRTHPIVPLTLPKVDGRRSPIMYTLTPDLPGGLIFDPSTRTLSGTPTEVIPATSFAYRATDVGGFWDWLIFTIEVYSPVSAEQDDLPDEFAVHDNYPNPFRDATNILVDLPWPARVKVEVLDVIGRRVFMQQPENLRAGSGQTITLRGMALPSGTYLYRLTADATEGHFVHLGHLVRIR